MAGESKDRPKPREIPVPAQVGGWAHAHDAGEGTDASEVDAPGKSLDREIPMRKILIGRRTNRTG